MFLYLGIYSCLALSAVGNYRKSHTVFFVVSGFFLVWFMGFRYEVGCDYFGYLNRWMNFNPEFELAHLLEGEEAGFALLMGSIKASGLDYTWLNVAASAILVLCYIRFASAYEFAPLIVTLLFPVIIIQFGMSGIRQALAGGFLMMAFNAFTQKKKIRTAIWILAGMQFHISVVIFLPISLLAGREFNTIRVFSAMLILGPVAAMFLADRFDTYESRYIENTVSAGGAIIRYILILIPVPFFIMNKSKFQRMFPDIFPLLKLGTITIISLSPLIVLSSIALHRLIFYVMPLSIILCVYATAVLAKKTSQLHQLIALTYGTYSTVWFLSSKHAQSCYIPYQNTWFF